MIEVDVGEETRGEGGEEDESLHSAEDDDAGREDCILGYVSFFLPRFLNALQLVNRFWNFSWVLKI